SSSPSHHAPPPPPSPLPLHDALPIFGLVETPAERAHSFARDLAVAMEAEHPKLVVHRMDKALRTGKVLIDWSQNAAAKTTVAPRSEEHTSELQSRSDLVCRLLLEKKK